MLKVLAGITLLHFPAANVLAVEPAAYFLMDGNPVAVKYVAGRLQQLPSQSVADAERLHSLESVEALQSATCLHSLSTVEQPKNAVQLSAARQPEYGIATFKVTGTAARSANAPSRVVWSGPVLFQEIVPVKSQADAGLIRVLTTQSRAALVPLLDYRKDAAVQRRLEIDGPVHTRDYGRVAAAPHLAFIDVTWKIRDLPQALKNRGMVAVGALLTVEYVIDTRSGRTVFQNISNHDEIRARDMRLFKEPGGPLLMAESIDCVDGAAPLIMDLKNQTYDTGKKTDASVYGDCFPAQ